VVLFEKFFDAEIKKAVPDSSLCDLAAKYSDLLVQSGAGRLSENSIKACLNSKQKETFSKQALSLFEMLLPHYSDRILSVVFSQQDSAVGTEWLRGYRDAVVGANLKASKHYLDFLVKLLGRYLELGAISESRYLFSKLFTYRGQINDLTGEGFGNELALVIDLLRQENIYQFVRKNAERLQSSQALSPLAQWNYSLSVGARIEICNGVSGVENVVECNNNLIVETLKTSKSVFDSTSELGSKLSEEFQSQIVSESLQWKKKIVAGLERHRESGALSETEKKYLEREYSKLFRKFSKVNSGGRRS
jgi:hypothetical protein